MNSIETCMLSIVKQITSPGLMHETSAQGWCTRMTQKDGMDREVGGWFRMANTCKSMADSYQCMAKKTLQYCKVNSLQLIQINEKKIKRKTKKDLMNLSTCSFINNITSIFNMGSKENSCANVKMF